MEPTTTINNYYGITFNNSNVHGNTFQTINPQPARAENAPSRMERDVKQALEELLKATDGEGKRIFTEKAQWYSVHRVLSEYLGYPAKKTQFVALMKEIGMDAVQPACNYESLKKVSLNAEIERAKTALWPRFLAQADEKSRKQIVPAMKLMELLGVG